MRLNKTNILVSKSRTWQITGFGQLFQTLKLSDPVPCCGGAWVALWRGRHPEYGNSLVYWSREEVRRNTEPGGEGLECQEKELILYPLGKGVPSRIFEQ